MTNDIIALAANVALALSFIVGLIFGIAQVRAAARDRRDRLTLEALRNFQSLDLPRVRGHKVKQYLEGVGKDNGRHKEEIHQGVQA